MCNIAITIVLFTQDQVNNALEELHWKALRVLFIITVTHQHKVVTFNYFHYYISK